MTFAFSVGFRIRPDSPSPLIFGQLLRKNTAGFREEYRRTLAPFAAEFRRFQRPYLTVSAGCDGTGQGPF